jgi:hypothetical protein
MGATLHCFVDSKVRCWTANDHEVILRKQDVYNPETFLQHDAIVTLDYPMVLMERTTSLIEDIPILTMVMPD